MRPLPPLLETYEEARLLVEVKGWGVTKAAEELSEMPELADFNISQGSFSKKSVPGSNVPIEPAVAAAVESLKTWPGHERKTDIVTRGLLALHGDPPIVDVRQLAKELRECLPASELALKLVEALEENAGQRATRLFQKLAERVLRGELTNGFGALAERLGRASGKRAAITAGAAALVSCLTLLLAAPLLPGRADAAGKDVFLVPAIKKDDSPVWLRFEPGSLLAVADPLRRPAEQEVPKSTLPGQKVAPCDAELGESDIHGNCWYGSSEVKPPCGRLFRHGDKCYRPAAADSPRKPAP